MSGAARRAGKPSCLAAPRHALHRKHTHHGSPQHLCLHVERTPPSRGVRLRAYHALHYIGRCCRNAIRWCCLGFQLPQIADDCFACLSTVGWQRQIAHEPTSQHASAGKYISYKTRLHTHDNHTHMNYVLTHVLCKAQTKHNCWRSRIDRTTSLH